MEGDRGEGESENRWRGRLIQKPSQESEEESAEDRKKDDEERVQRMVKVVGVEEEEEGKVEVKFRAGKKTEGGKPRPLILRLGDSGIREKMLRNARELGRKEEWRKVFLAPDLTYKQREEAKEEERKLREEADQRTTEAKNEGRTEGRFVVVGPRGRRRVVWWEERGARA